MTGPEALAAMAGGTGAPAPAGSRFKAAVFGWAGKMVDFGCFAPMGVFVEALARFGVTATIDQAPRTKS